MAQKMRAPVGLSAEEMRKILKQLPSSHEEFTEISVRFEEPPEGQCLDSCCLHVLDDLNVVISFSTHYAAFHIPFVTYTCIDVMKCINSY